MKIDHVESRCCGCLRTLGDGFDDDGGDEGARSCKIHEVLIDRSALLQLLKTRRTLRIMMNTPVLVLPLWMNEHEHGL